MDYKVILNLMKEMNRTDLTKLEIEEEGVRICIEKAANVVTVNQPAFSPTNMAPMSFSANPMSMMPMQTPVFPGQQAESTQQNTTTGQASEAALLAEKQAEEIGKKKIVSPMVGTFYGSSSPDKPPFVKVGDIVKKGQTVCILEAMKLMNEIESDHDGEIVKILVNNEDMVEFGQPMFLIK